MSTLTLNFHLLQIQDDILKVKESDNHKVVTKEKLWWTMAFIFWSGFSLFHDLDYAVIPHCTSFVCTISVWLKHIAFYFIYFGKKFLV